MTKLEQVARAIAEARTPPERRLRGDDWAMEIEHTKREARAAIEALMEPDEAMMGAGAEYTKEGAFHGFDDPSPERGCLQAMLRTVLEGK